ncbi:hypothetical protein KO561_10150 [Radiobacillus kanasensis]|uniref:hypothetical protein n=1 Tax=Radiobacillus kanasensis TaxID=2844358 RepID=UPI001E64AF8A|nr:hypothetical protein [Radiobacillus kanasensis]UFU01269.1 hypothetical protein KO561_10150 [Radiobacillus kanasensis]
MNTFIQKQKDTHTAHVTKKEFEKGFIELMDQVRLLEQKVATKADDQVLTLTLAHRHELGTLQTEVLSLRKEVKQLRKQTYSPKPDAWKDRVMFSIKHLFKNMQFARK